MNISEVFPVVAGLRDYVIPLTTPYDDAGEIDLDAVKHNIDRTLEVPACGGIYFGSVYQEFWTFTSGERCMLFETVADHLAKRQPLIAGISSSSYQESKRLAAEATQAGADILMLWPPTWGPRDHTGVLDFFHRVLDDVEVPTFVYTTTLRELDYYMPPDVIEALANEIPQICGIKDGTGNVTHFLDLTRRFGDRLYVASPFEEYWALAKLAYPDQATEFLLGASRPMYMQSARNPVLEHSLQAFRNGDHPEGFRLLGQLNGLVKAQMDSFSRGVHPIAMVKYAGSLLGMRGVEPRPPTPRLSDADKALVRDLMLDAGIIA
jgi:4-hydroxy-tetrahydrodipicolinate synthase